MQGTGDSGELWNDLKAFHERHYSADRMRLVIQVKTADNLCELRQWVEASFSAIPNKNLGLQDFSKINNKGGTASQSVG